MNFTALEPVAVVEGTVKVIVKLREVALDMLENEEGEIDIAYMPVSFAERESAVEREGPVSRTVAVIVLEVPFVTARDVGESVRERVGVETTGGIEGFSGATVVVVVEFTAVTVFVVTETDVTFAPVFASRPVNDIV